MMVTLDLTSRQAERLLEQALRNRAELSLEPRTWADDAVITGRLASRDANLLGVELDEGCSDAPLSGLIGAFCDGRTILSGSMYLFSTCIVDVSDHTTPRRLLLAAPGTFQLVNRRKFLRREFPHSAPVHVRTEPDSAAADAELLDVSNDGIALSVKQSELEDVLLVGDSIRVGFELAGLGGYFDMPAVVCSKTPVRGEDRMIVGLQFDAPQGDVAAGDALARLRSVLCEMFTNTTSTEGEA